MLSTLVPVVSVASAFLLHVTSMDVASELLLYPSLIGSVTSTDMNILVSDCTAVLVESFQLERCVNWIKNLGPTSP